MSAPAPGTTLRLAAAAAAALMVAAAWSAYRSPALGLMLDAFRLCG